MSVFRAETDLLNRRMLALKLAAQTGARPEVIDNLADKIHQAVFGLVLKAETLIAKETGDEREED